MSDYLEILDKIQSSPVTVSPDTAYLLYGYTPEEYRAIKLRLNRDGQFQEVSDLGFNLELRRRHRSESDDYRAVAINVPDSYRSRGDVIGNLQTILRHATPPGRSLVLLLTDHPDSVWVQSIPDNYLVLVMSPTRIQIDQAPGSDWEEIAGGWKKGHVIVSKKSLLLARQSNGGGRLRFSAAQAERRKVQIKELCDGHWPEDGTNDLAEAQEALAQIEQARAVLEDVETYQHQSFPQLSSALRHKAASEQRLQYSQERLRNLKAEVAQYETQLEEIGQTIATETVKSNFDRRVKFAQVNDDFRAVQEVADLDVVESADLLDPLLNKVTLKVETKIKGPRGRVNFSIDQYGVHFSRDVNEVDIEPRLLAIAEKFSRGQMAEAVQIVCQTVLASDDYRIEND